jgi:chromosome segregation ATPase
MARYTATLLAPLHARLEELSRDVGRLQAERDAARAELERRDVELEQARAQLAEAIGSKAPPEPQNGATHQGEERRRWWQRLFSWDTAEGGA